MCVLLEIFCINCIVNTVPLYISGLVSTDSSVHVHAVVSVI